MLTFVIVVMCVSHFCVPVSAVDGDDIDDTGVAGSNDNVNGSVLGSHESSSVGHGHTVTPFRGFSLPPLPEAPSPVTASEPVSAVMEIHTERSSEAVLSTHPEAPSPVTASEPVSAVMEMHTERSSEAVLSTQAMGDYYQWCSDFELWFDGECERLRQDALQRNKVHRPMYIDEANYDVLWEALRCKNCEWARRETGRKGCRVTSVGRRSCKWISLGMRTTRTFKRDVYRHCSADYLPASSDVPRQFLARETNDPAIRVIRMSAGSDKRIKVKRSFIPYLISAYHIRHGCMKAHALRQALAEEYFGIPRWAIEYFCKGCPICPNRAKGNSKRKALVVQKSTRYRQKFQCDLIDCISIAGRVAPFRYILTMKDHFSGYGMATAQVTKTKDETMRNILIMMLQYGFPSGLQSDNGGEFTSNVLEKLMSELRVDTWHGRGHHPQSQGSVENWNKFLIHKLGYLLRQHDTTCWWLLLPLAVALINCQWSRRIFGTPYEYVFGGKFFNKGILSGQNLAMGRCLMGFGAGVDADDSGSGDDDAKANLMVEQHGNGLPNHWSVSKSPNNTTPEPPPPQYRYGKPWTLLAPTLTSHASWYDWKDPRSLEMADVNLETIRTEVMRRLSRAWDENAQDAEDARNGQSRRSRPRVEATESQLDAVKRNALFVLHNRQETHYSAVRSTKQVDFRANWDNEVYNINLVRHGQIANPQPRGDQVNKVRYMQDVEGCIELQWGVIANAAAEWVQGDGLCLARALLTAMGLPCTSEAAENLMRGAIYDMIHCNDWMKLLIYFLSRSTRQDIQTTKLVSDEKGYSYSEQELDKLVVEEKTNILNNATNMLLSALSDPREAWNTGPDHFTFGDSAPRHLSRVLGQAIAIVTPEFETITQDIKTSSHGFPKHPPPVKFRYGKHRGNPVGPPTNSKVAGADDEFETEIVPQDGKLSPSQMSSPSTTVIPGIDLPLSQRQATTPEITESEVDVLMQPSFWPPDHEETANAAKRILKTRRAPMAKRKKHYDTARQRQNNRQRLAVGTQICIAVNKPVPKNKTDMPYIRGVIIEVRNNGYQVGTKWGVIAGSITDNEIWVQDHGNKRLHLDIEAVPNAVRPLSWIIKQSNIAKGVTRKRKKPTKKKQQRQPNTESEQKSKKQKQNTTAKKCRCTTGTCVRCVCRKAQQKCTDQCKCNPNICTNQVDEDTQVNGAAESNNPNDTVDSKFDDDEDTQVNDAAESNNPNNPNNPSDNHNQDNDDMNINYLNDDNEGKVTDCESNGTSEPNNGSLFTRNLQWMSGYFSKQWFDQNHP